MTGVQTCALPISGWHHLLGTGPRTAGRPPVAPGAADRELPHPGRDHGGHRGPPGRDRPWTAAAAVRARDRRAALADGHHPRRAPGGARRDHRSGSRERRTARDHRARCPGTGTRGSRHPRRTRRVVRRQPRLDQRDRPAGSHPGQGPGVRLGAHRRPRRDPRRIAARPQRPLRRDDPQHPAARHRASGAAARGDNRPAATAAAGREITGVPALPCAPPLRGPA